MHNSATTTKTSKWISQIRALPMNNTFWNSLTKHRSTILSFSVDTTFRPSSILLATISGAYCREFRRLHGRLKSMGTEHPDGSNSATRHASWRWVRRLKIPRRSRYFSRRDRKVRRHRESIEDGCWIWWTLTTPQFWPSLLGPSRKSTTKES